MLPYHYLLSSGVVLVTTPQAAALEVARRGAIMFQRLKVPIIGVVQNMNTIVCPKCQHSMSLHGHGTEALASELGNDDTWFQHYAPL
jgi:ATP-binding protein involved in chromosome partitioning